MKKKWAISIAILVIVVICATAFWQFYKKNQQPPKQAKPTISYIKTAQVKQINWPTRVLLLGHVYAVKGVMLRAQYAGQVTKVRVSSGQLVNKDQLLLEINPKILAAQIAQDQSNLNLAREKYQQNTQLYRKGFISKLDYEISKDNYLADQATLHQTQQQWNLTQVKAPFTGRFGVLKVHLGDYVNLGDAVGFIGHAHSFRIDINVPTRYLNKVHLGEQIYFQSEALGQQQYTARIFAIDSKIDQSSRSFEVRALIASPPKNMATGLVGNVLFLFNHNQQALVIPQTALVFSLSGPSVFIIQNGIAKQVPIKLGTVYNGLISVKQGLQKGQVVAADGGFKLHNGAKVKAVQ